MGFFKRFKKPKSTISLKIPTDHTELGETLKGTIAVTSQEEFDSTEIRAELRCIERCRKERWVFNKRLGRNERQVYWDQATLHSFDPKVNGQIHIVPGFKKEFPLIFTIPIAGRESYDGLDTNVTWQIKGIVAVDNRPDVTGKTLELQVIRPTAGSKTKAEKTVMVSCEYCESLMENTTSACPNCGAPRKKRD